MPVDPSSTLAELVLERPARTHVFERAGLDYCCGGDATLADACAERGLDAATLALVLDADSAGALPAGERDWTCAPLADLCVHIVEAHHGRLRQELPRLEALCDKVVAAHGADRPELADVRDTLRALSEELQVHMVDEEQNLFPPLVAGLVPDDRALAQLEDEHAETGAALRRLRELTAGYDPAHARCTTHRALLDGLAELEADVHLHVHEENHVLFPRARALV